MNTILAISMASLFTWWVWSLKHELAKRQKAHHLASAEAASPAHAGPVHMHGVHAPKPLPAQAHMPHPESQKHRNAGGVPVWTIG